MKVLHPRAQNFRVVRKMLAGLSREERRIIRKLQAEKARLDKEREIKTTGKPRMFPPPWCK